MNIGQVGDRKDREIAMHGTMTPRAVELTENIAELAQDLSREVRRDDLERPPHEEIQAIRRSLQTLEMELREGSWSTNGDAC